MYANLRAEMARKDVTISELADLIHISASGLSKKLTGRSPLLYDEALSIKSVLGVDMPVEILFDTEEGS